jgi:predicted CXXCH cytochrome family protein
VNVPTPAAVATAVALGVLVLLSPSAPAVAQTSLERGDATNPPTTPDIPVSVEQETFHSGGVGYCGGCHANHAADGAAPGPNLLIGQNATDTCLRCHATEAGNTWGNSLLAPGPVYGGGSFIFLTEDNLNDGPGGSDPANWIGGNHAGHNVVSPARGISPDLDHPTSPGGTYPSQHLTCTSCHDPHGRAGNFRMLYGRNSPASRSDGYEFSFPVDPPLGVGIGLTTGEETAGNHTAYLENWTDWCAACHGRFHDEPPGDAIFEHPVREGLGGDERDRYDAYEGTGFWNSGDPNRSYLPMVAYQSRDSTTSWGGPTPSDAEVTCVTCHRAHASSAPAAGRWDFEITTWADEGTVSDSYAIPNPYASTAGDDQRRLCGKCRGQDRQN